LLAESETNKVHDGLSEGPKSQNDDFVASDSKGAQDEMFNETQGVTTKAVRMGRLQKFFAMLQFWKQKAQMINELPDIEEEEEEKF